MGGISQGLINGHGVRVRLRGFPDAGKRETQKRAGVGKIYRSKVFLILMSLGNAGRQALYVNLFFIKSSLSDQNL